MVLELQPDPVLAFLHEPAAPVPGATAALICPQFGWEEACTYRGQRRWAQTLAAAGHPAARLNLPGTGDSGGGPRDPDRLAAWTDAVAGAAGWLREVSGSRRVAAIGVGLGGMLAWRAVAGGAPIDDLLLWAVPARGRTLLRELRAPAALVAERYADEERPLPLDGELELNGFVLSAQTAVELEGLDLSVLSLPAAAGRRALLVERDGIAVDRRLIDALERAGAEVSVRRGGDYGAWLADPQSSLAPIRTIANSIGWLSSAGAPPGPASAGGGAPADAGRVPSGQVASRPVRAPAHRRSMELEVPGGAIVESPVCLKADGVELFGVLSRSADRPAAAACAVLLGAGAVRHIGPHRAWVEAARRWAARGVPTVRLDLPGIGDAGGEDRGLVLDPCLYAARRTAQTLAALDQLPALGLPPRFVLGGFCSGAYWSLHAALADPRVIGALMVNLYAFEWSEALVAERDGTRSLGALRGRGWRKLLRGDASSGEVAATLASVRPDRIRTGAGRPVESAQRELVVSALDRLHEQGTEALLLLSRAEPLYDQLVRQGVLEAASGRWPNLAIDQIPTRDHLFRGPAMQRFVHGGLDSALDRALRRTSPISGCEHIPGG